MSHRNLSLVLLCAALLLVGSGQPTVLAAIAPPQIFVDSNGVAISGFDVVSYFEERKPRKGLQKWNAEYKGAKFYFATMSNRDLFRKSPETYVPRFGGYCAYAMGHGGVTKCDPRRFTLRDGRLYLFSSSTARDEWEADGDHLIANAVAMWRRLFSDE